MKRISSKVFIVILSCSLFAVGLLGAISIAESSRQARIDAESILLWMTRDYADKFSAELLVIEDKLVEIDVFMQNTIDFKKLKSDKDYLTSYEPILAEFIKNFADKRTESIAGWVYFDPKWSVMPHDVYFVDGDGDKIADRQTHIPFSYYDNTPVPDDDKQWWYGPKETGKTFWTNPYEWRLINGEVINVVSCARPFFIDGEFIGVIGTYYRFNEMQNEIKSIKVYNSGRTFLFNEKLDVVIHPEFFAGTRFTSDNLKTVKNGQYLNLADEILKKAYGIITYTDSGEDMVLAFAKLSNGWVMAVSPQVAEIYSGVYKIVYKLLMAILCCVIVSFIAAHYMGKLLTLPILKVAEAAKIIGTGDLSVKVEVDTKDEVKQLADSLNNMTSNITQLQEELVKQAYYDDLTGVKNLRKFKIDAAALVTEHPFTRYALIKRDVAKFKMLNELYGFDEGDRIIKNIAKAIDDAIDHDTDTFARVTSDEFIVLVSFTDTEALEDKRIAFLRNFNKLNGDNKNYIIFKEGRYLIEQDETDIATILEKVNLAHRITKQSETQHICIYDEDVKRIAKTEKEIENRMEQALEDGEFKLFLQPKYLLANESIIGAEALVRWRTGTGQLSYPNEFIPLFERNGFVTTIDFYMLDQSCKALRAWIDEGLEPVKISVNFSRLHFNNHDFLDKLCNTIDKYGVPRKLIEIELTETAMFYNADKLTDFLTHLHREGVTLSMDDFGTGYSSLGLLKNLPVDVVKLDRSFFTDALDESRASVVIESIIGMTKKLGISIVAEGVEEKSHVELLQRFGCDIVQGYYFARPMPVEDFYELYKMSLAKKAGRA